MATIEFDGFILKKEPYKEHDEMITIYSNEYGKLKARVRGTKKITSKNRTAVEMLVLSRFIIEYNENKGFLLVTHVQLVDFVELLNVSLDKYITGCLMSQIIDESTIYNHPDPQLFNLYFEGISNLVMNESKLTLLRFLMGIVNYLGIQPQLGACTVCGSKNDILGFSIKQSGFICKSCRFQAELVNVSIDDLKPLLVIKNKNKDVEVSFTLVKMYLDYLIYYTRYKLPTYIAFNKYYKGDIT